MDDQTSREDLIEVLVGIRGVLHRIADALEAQTVRTRDAGELVASAVRTVTEELERHGP
jgi:hypothetical protein